jgi:ribosomal protein S18 acetylase RimI-like enzyme
MTSASLIVRPAQPADAPALRAILHDTFESTWAPNITPAAAAAFRREDRPAAYVAERGLNFWVAERGGEVVGLVDWQDDFVNALHVLARHARTGVGARLMDKAEREIARGGFAAVRLETDTFNTRSRAFYAARGYREAERYPDQEWGSGLTTLLLVKPLTTPERLAEPRRRGSARGAADQAAGAAARRAGSMSSGSGRRV